MERDRRGSLRTVTAIAFLISAMAMLGNVIIPPWPRPNEAPAMQLRTSRDLVLAYFRIRPGLTRASQLAQYGFDPTSSGTRLLSYLGVMERFIPHDSTAFDRLDAGVRACVAARERCTGLIFRPAGYASSATGSHGLFTAFGLGAEAVSRTPQVTLLIRDGRVAFKMISGVGETVPANRSTREARAVQVPFRMNYWPARFP